jgi:hypothetical protein
VFLAGHKLTRLGLPFIDLAGTVASVSHPSGTTLGALAALKRFAPPIKQVLPSSGLGPDGLPCFALSLDGDVAIEIAAAQSLMTPSEYVRRSVTERLKIGGIDLASIAARMASS